MGTNITGATGTWVVPLGVDILELRLSTFLLLQPFNVVHNVVVTPPPQNYFHCYVMPVILLLL